MSLVLGIDPGTKSFDFCGLEDGKVVLNDSILSSDIADKPAKFAELVRSRKWDYIVGPSGYGLPLKRLSELKEGDLFLLTLVKPEELQKISVLSGMQKAFAILLEEDIPMYFIPGVIHLPTVPSYRKLNKIDMGTADKLCCAVLGIVDQANRLSVPYDKTSFILLEIGFGYTSAIAVDKGRIVAGVGGTGGGPGYTSIGSMDGELAYLLGEFSKTALFDGGASSLLRPRIEPEKIKEGTDAWNTLIESAVRDVLMLLSSVDSPREILISGRLARTERITAELKKRLAKIAPARRVEGISNEVKEAAQGAAILADGLAGGRYKGLVENMKLREARGTVLDYITLESAKGMKKNYKL